MVLEQEFMDRLLKEKACVTDLRVNAYFNESRRVRGRETECVYILLIGGVRESN